jgi:hypothetical protein
MGRRKKYSDAQIAEALKKAGGVITDAAEIMGTERAWLSKRVSASEMLQEIRKECEEKMLDLAEGNMYSLIRRKDRTMIIFYLKTKGKARGYIERSEFTGAGGGPVEIIVSYKKK